MTDELNYMDEFQIFYNEWKKPGALRVHIVLFHLCKILGQIELVCSQRKLTSGCLGLGITVSMTVNGYVETSGVMEVFHVLTVLTDTWVNHLSVCI